MIHRDLKPQNVLVSNRAERGAEVLQVAGAMRLCDRGLRVACGVLCVVYMRAMCAGDVMCVGCVCGVYGVCGVGVGWRT